MSNRIYNINDLCIDINTFKYNTNITSVDLKNIRWGKIYGDEFNITDSMATAFRNCYNLKHVFNLNDDLRIMDGAFMNCISLEKAPEIPKNVTKMNQTFYNCINLTGDVKISSEYINDITNCFYNSVLPKNLYIPFYDYNGNETQTYKAFKNSGYIEGNIKDNITIKDYKEEHAILRIIADVDDAKIYTVNDLGEQIEFDGSMTVKKGTSVRYIAINDDMIIEDEIVVNDDMTIELSLRNNLIDVTDYTYRMISGDVILEKYIGNSVNIIVPILKERT